ncbi:sensor histidine kinase [Mangrovicella endophytica]|uniref:sensor histidine kinase n=1 Tax=Mangrovicella endophytica TaxID=2066697 RepID=UPI000C9DC89B|nr:HAMP domain-containing sensor histidine kinase [Mangrovicella endophytica]
MSVAAPPIYDKNIVERRRGSKNPSLSRTLKATRERLASKGGVTPRFDRELLVQHAASLRSAAIVLPMPLLLTIFGLSVFTGATPALVWAVVALAGYSTLLIATIRFTRLDPAELDPRRWTRFFLAGHFSAGIGWAYFAGLGCTGCAPLRFEILQFAILFLAIALTAMVSSTLKFATIVAFLPVSASLLVTVLLNPDPTTAAMQVMLVLTVPFFALVAERLRRNTTERMKHQAEKDELIAELETARIISDEARRRAEDANLAKSRFLATMSHELRTPLNAILGFSEVIENEILGPVGNATYKDYVKDIHSSGQHLLDLINEILDLSRVEAGRYALNEEAVESVAVARSCLAYIDMRAKAKDITVKGHFEADLPALWADARSLRQIILNLLSNAVKFTPSGGEIKLRVGWTAGGGQYISVKDNGPGIPEEEIPIVLSSFGQGSIAIKSAEQGAGLGLPIVQALVAMHDGEFQLLSKLREGTEAIAIFPHSRVLEVMPALADYT